MIVLHLWCGLFFFVFFCISASLQSILVHVHLFFCFSDQINTNNLKDLTVLQTMEEDLNLLLQHLVKVSINIEYM